ncbi:hypothetical protein SAMN05444157_2883 [Frankineae bacterium MT45]|nr:hypothetical protein SAMN05444157_2883 [Frankineae bacterium MT45]
MITSTASGEILLVIAMIAFIALSIVAGSRRS